MCIIVFVADGVDIPSNAILHNCWKTNPDGGGVMYNDGKDVHFSKGYMTWTRFSKAIDCLRRHRSKYRDIALHFRIASHGSISENNCHPWLIQQLNGRRYCMMHNGIISWCGYDRQTSDSFVLSNKLISFNLEDYESRTILEHAIGSNNKLVIMKNNGTHILNESSGVWCDKIWYSNGGYAIRTTPRTDLNKLHYRFWET